MHFKSSLYTSLLLLLTAILPWNGANAQEKYEPAWSNLSGCDYPQVSFQMNVRVRFHAPNASKVEVAGGDGFTQKPIALAKDKEGYWFGTVSNVTPGFHYYWFNVDGVQVNDPASVAYMGYGRPTSGLYAPTPGEEFLECKQVPHGDVREHTYFSEVTGKWRRAYVYTPAGYDRGTKNRYPILYLLHGAGEDERGWTLQGRMNFILDNLIAEGKAVPMVVVMDNGYATAKGDTADTSLSRDGMKKRAEVLMDVYKKDIIPTFETSYRIKQGRENRAMAGLSMGGFETLLIGLNNTDMFAYYGAFSAAIIGGLMDNPKTAFNGVFADAEAFNKNVKLLWFGVGSNETRFVEMVADTRDKLNGLGINAQYYQSENTYHEWHTWSRCLHQFAPLLFK